ARSSPLWRRLSVVRRPPTSTLVPYTTLFRSQLRGTRDDAVARRRAGAERRVARPRDGVVLARVDGVVQVPVAEHERDAVAALQRSEEHTSELQLRRNLVCRLLLEKKKMTEAH